MQRFYARILVTLAIIAIIAIIIATDIEIANRRNETKRCITRRYKFIADAKSSFTK